MSDDTIYGQEKRGARLSRFRPKPPTIETACDRWPPEAWVRFTERLATDPAFRERCAEAQDARLDRYHEILEELITQHVPLARGQYRELSAIAHRRALADVPRPNPLED